MPLMMECGSEHPRRRWPQHLLFLSLTVHLCVCHVVPVVNTKTLRQSIPIATQESARIRKAAPVRGANAFIAPIAIWESNACCCRERFGDSETDRRPVNCTRRHAKVNNSFVTGKLEPEDVQYMIVLDTARSAAHSLTNRGICSSPSGQCRVE